MFQLGSSATPVGYFKPVLSRQVPANAPVQQLKGVPGPVHALTGWPTMVALGAMLPLAPGPKMVTLPLGSTAIPNGLAKVVEPPLIVMLGVGVIVPLGASKPASGNSTMLLLP